MRRYNCYPHFKVKETEAWRLLVTCLRNTAKKQNHKANPRSMFFSPYNRASAQLPSHGDV